MLEMLQRERGPATSPAPLANGRRAVAEAVARADARTFCLAPAPALTTRAPERGAHCSRAQQQSAACSHCSAA